MRESGRAARIILDEMDDLVALLDREGRILEANKAALAAAGASLSDIAGVPLWSISIWPADRAERVHLGCQRAAAGELHRESIDLQAAGGAVPIDLSLKPIAEGGAIQLILAEGRRAIGRSAEEERLAEALRQQGAQLARLAEEIQHSNRELESFTYAVSHDLRAPLRTIDGFSTALLDDYGPVLEGSGQDYLRRVRAGVERMSRLIDDLLRLARVARAELRDESVDLTGLAREVAQELARSQPARQVDFRAEPSPPAHGDRRLLRIVLENLLGNAWKFTGKVAEPAVEFGTTERDGRAAYYLRDNGVGFDMRYAGRLFAPFQRLHADDEFPGSGVGLATAQRIVRRHGGLIWADGTPDAGATFFFTLGR